MTRKQRRSLASENIDSNKFLVSLPLDASADEAERSLVAAVIGIGVPLLR